MMLKRLNVVRFIVSSILILSLTLSAGCEIISGKNGTLPSEQPQATTENAAPTDTERSIASVTENITPIDTEWSIPPAQSQSPILPGIADVVARVKPSVVAINTEVITLDFFNRPFTQEGAGSGWIIDKDGIILTNNHVVEGAKSITVTLDDGRTFMVDMNTVATDPLTDLAILKIKAQNLPAATVGDSAKLRIGDWVVAIGNSLGRGIRATVGIVSQLGVSLQVDEEQTLYNLLETSAAINPGNSGGPLVNIAGEVIGITSAKIAATGVEGMGYAISSQEAIPIIQQLITTGYVIRPWMGVNFYTVDEYVTLRYSLAVDKGAFIVYVAPNSPAERAGLRSGDVIIRFGDKEITDTNELLRAIHSAQIGQNVEITFWRGKAKTTTFVIPIKSPPPS